MFLNTDRFPDLEKEPFSHNFDKWGKNWTELEKKVGSVLYFVLITYLTWKSHDIKMFFQKQEFYRPLENTKCWSCYEVIYKKLF